MNNQVFRRKNASGSAIVIILILVALFGALSFALSQGTRSGEAQIGDEKARLAATEIMDYGRVVRDAVKTMRINGIELRAIDFRANTLVAQNGNPYPMTNDNCTTDPCQVFSALGGAINAVQFYEYGFEQSWWQPTWVHVGGVEPAVANVVGVGTILPDFVFRVAGVNPKICEAFNKLNGINVWPTGEDQTGRTFYTYNYNVDTKLAALDAYHFGVETPELQNKMAFCSGGDWGGEIFIVIEAR